MRIITGSARGTRLETLEGLETRPTGEKVKEAIFSMLQFELEGREVLDAFGGSGQLALEALSRGAKKATILDQSADAVQIIRRNAQKAKLYEKCVVLQSEARAFLRTALGRKFDIVFLDPPYQSDLVNEMLKKLVAGDFLAENAVVVCESDRKEPFAAEGLTLRRHAKYGTVYVTVLERHSEAEMPILSSDGAFIPHKDAL